ncbi:MAG TPA: hypothetical protein VG013_25745 [Gemmataceae bacterium]|nr:hypothetical protein [Gemmataceae bacterium]
MSVARLRHDRRNSSQILDCLGTPLVIEPSQGQLSSDAGRRLARPR